MSFDDFKFLINQFTSFKGQLDLHGYGEPLLDVNLIEKVRYAKQKLEKSKIVFYTTLGVPIKPGFFYKGIVAS